MTNEEIRREYRRRVAEIGALDQRWVSEDRLPLGERARRAFRIRREARLGTRALMEDPIEVEKLRARDQAKYGDPDGPTFEQLVAEKRSQGLGEEQAYEAILKSAARTDAATNLRMGM